MWLRAIKWIVFSNVWVSLSVAAYTFYGCQLGQVEIPLIYCVITFFATLFAYNFQRLIKVNTTKSALSERHIWINKNFLTIRLITIFSGLACFALALTFIKKEVLILTVPLIIIVLIYAGNKFIKFPLRVVPFVKILAISLVWSAVIYVVPFVNETHTWQSINWTYFSSVFLLTFSLCIPFDIRDLDADFDVVKTIPSAIGVKNAKFLMILILFIIIVISIQFQWWALLVVSLISIIMGFLTKKSNPELFFTGGIDGVFLLLPLLHCVFEILS